jgi:16S rRNA (adenine1518-N6/adenine1519-N6)-dimethyltransferase
MSRQASLARLREFGITPDRELGQNFLIDDNMLEVAGGMIGLDGEDVAVEVGAGLGVLTAWLADRVRLVHAIEIDGRLEPALRATLGDRANVRLMFADGVAVDMAGLDPAPTVMVANLPYGVATPVIMRSLPAVPRFCVMVQREIADRLFAAPHTRAYGAVSVLVQIACRRVGRRPVSRSVFVPQPNVDSAMVAFERRPEHVFDDGWPWLVQVVQAAFSHRRKTLANSLSLAGLPAPPPDLAGVRAQELEPARFVELAGELAA